MVASDVETPIYRHYQTPFRGSVDGGEARRDGWCVVSGQGGEKQNGKTVHTENTERYIPVVHRTVRSRAAVQDLYYYAASLLLQANYSDANNRSV